MKLRWGKERIKGFSSLVKKAERTNDWAWWVLFVVVVIMEVMVILKILGKM